MLFHKDARSEYGGLTIYDDAFKNYLWVKVFDDNAFAIIKSHFSFSFVCVLTWSLLAVRSISFRGLIQNFRRASVPTSYVESPLPGFFSKSNWGYYICVTQIAANFTRFVFKNSSRHVQYEISERCMMPYNKLAFILMPSTLKNKN